MLTYHLKIAIKSLRRNPVLTCLLIGGIALGICVSTAFVTLRHLYTQDPLPGKSDKVFYVRLDSWGKKEGFRQGNAAAGVAPIPDQVTYRDARNLLRSPIPVRQTATYITRMFVYPDAKASRPFQPDVRFVFSDFFDMFQLPFEYGGPWTKAADAKPEQVVVIDNETNSRVFGGANSVGKTIRLGERDYRVVGVLAPYRPAVRLFDMTRNALGAPEPVYIPFNMTEVLRIYSAGNNSGWKNEEIKSIEDNWNSERVWLQYWVELPTPEAKRNYEQWLTNYINDQKRHGRFERPLYFRLDTVPQLIEEWGLMPAGVKAMSVVALLFLVVCSVNLVGILLGKFLARLPEVSVRRALGASRAQIFWQHLVECELIGAVGGIAGIALSAGILAILARFLQNGEALHLDGEMLGIAAILSLVAGAVAGIYPAWRVCSVAPAMQLKVQ
ncbi:MAG TPA: ABC transporter permease [Thermoanaerobaculia bacterium]|nr:ABC transporter permease [Thermoanaerobaculia bacterium]